MLKHTRNILLNLNNINTLNTQIVTHLLISKFTNIINLVQKYKTRYLINHLEAINFTFVEKQNLIPFYAKHSRNKKDKGSLIYHENLFGIHEDERNAIGSDILYYCKEMPPIILLN